MLQMSRLGVWKCPNESASQFTVINVIYNHRYGVYRATSSQARKNLVLIQVTPEFTEDPELSPICLSESENELKGLVRQQVYFYGLQGIALSRAEDKYNAQKLNLLATATTPSSWTSF